MGGYPVYVHGLRCYSPSSSAGIIAGIQFEVMGLRNNLVYLLTAMELVFAILFGKKIHCNDNIIISRWNAFVQVPLVTSFMAVGHNFCRLLPLLIALVFSFRG